MRTIIFSMGCLTKKDSTDSANDSADMGKLRGEMSFSRPLSVAQAGCLARSRYVVQYAMRFVYIIIL